MENPDHSLSAYDYVLPASAIAQSPKVPRDQARLLQVRPTLSSDRVISHHIFADLPQFIQPGDLLVFNDTKVIPARWYGQKNTGTPIEILLIEPVADNCWLALVKPGRRVPVGTRLEFQAGVSAEVVGVDLATRGRFLRFDLPEGKTLERAMEEQGVIPLPPYITDSPATPDQYQTVYARHGGAVAAPTAGLHFTHELLHRLRAQGVEQQWITLHVGIGTFRPVETENITQHQMHQEWVEVSEAVIQAIQATHDRGGRVIGVGTTVARALETAQGKAFCGKTDLMIYPGYRWQVLDGLITNFHLPRSSLMMLVASFLGEGGRAYLLDLYQTAIEQDYRFYSFGDATLLWRTRTD